MPLIDLRKEDRAARFAKLISNLIDEKINYAKEEPSHEWFPSLAGVKKAEHDLRIFLSEVEL